MIRSLKDELGRKIMTYFAALWPEKYSYLTDGNVENKNVKGGKKCLITRKLRFNYHKNCLKATQLENKINHLEHIKLI